MKFVVVGIKLHVVLLAVSMAGQSCGCEHCVANKVLLNNLDVTPSHIGVLYALNVWQGRDA